MPEQSGPRADVSAAEAYVVQACMYDRMAIPVARALVDPTDFTTLSMRQAFEAILHLHDAGADTSYGSVIEWVDTDKREPVRDVYRKSTGATRVAQYARIVAETATLERLGIELGKVIDQARAGDISAVEAARTVIDGLVVPRGAPEPSLDVKQFMAITEPYDWVVPDLIERGDRLLITGAEGQGKALDVDTQVPTPEGWATMGTLEVGDEILGGDGNPCRVAAVTTSWVGRRCYRVGFSDGAEIVADAQHQWPVVTDLEGRVWEWEQASLVLTTDEIRHALQLSAAPYFSVVGPEHERRHVRSVTPVPSVSVRCVQVDRDDGIFLVGRERIPTHNSTLLRQMAVSVATGMHPFEYHPFLMSNSAVPRVSIFDMENSPSTVRRKLADLLGIEGVQRNLDPTRLRIECRPGGVDLTTRRDRAWLTERVMANRPDLMVIGPVYKLYDGDPNDERLARAVTAVLDDLRTRFGCALLIEAHSPHGGEGGRRRDLRPFGSSLWRRWPEFGYGLHPTEDPKVMQFKAWRGDRDVRSWPKQLVRSEPWPWGTGRAVGRPVPPTAAQSRQEELENEQF